MYNEILLLADRSPVTEQAMPRVFDFAERFDATVHVLFIVNMTWDSVGAVGSTVFDTLEREDRRVVDEVEACGERHGIEMYGVVRRDAPHDAILDYAIEHGVKVIVMATHGWMGIERVLLGSVTERVAWAAPVPVLAVCAAE